MNRPAKKKVLRVRALARRNGAAKSDDWTPTKERAFLRKLARDQLQHLQEEVRRTGSGFDVLRAISVCAMRDVAMPKWLALEFMARYRAVTHCSVASWDEAFGRPYPKGAHLSALRKAFKYPLEVYKLVRLRRARGKGIGKILFQEVADELALNATETESFYYRGKRMMNR
jgi:GNAT superfamily N-acetyltransferase